MTAHCLCTPKTHTIIHDHSLSFDIFFSEVSMVFTALVLRYKFLFICVLLFSVTSNSPHFCDYSKSRSGFPSTYLVVFLLSMFNELRWEDFVRFVDIGWIIDHHSLSCLCFVDIGGIIDHDCLSCLLFCWYWCNYWPSLFKLSFVLLILVELLTITV
jgi:hypothetical protein